MFQTACPLAMLLSLYFLYFHYLHIVNYNLCRTKITVQIPRGITPTARLVINLPFLAEAQLVLVNSTIFYMPANIVSSKQVKTGSLAILSDRNLDGYVVMFICLILNSLQ